jgi:hypothetical protein
MKRYLESKSLIIEVSKESTLIARYYSENLPPAFAEAASRRQVAPLACLCDRKKIAKEG